MSKYKIEQDDKGFAVLSDDRPSVYVDTDGYELSMYSGSECSKIGSCPLPRFRDMVDGVVSGLYFSYKRPEKHRDENNFSHVYFWSKKRTRWALNNRLYHEWKRLIGMADPLTWNVQKKAFAYTFHVSAFLLQPWFYTYEDICRDLIKYPAAVHVLNRLEELLGFHGRRTAEEMFEAWRREISGALRMYGVSVSQNARVTEDLGVDAVVKGMRNWKGLLSPDEVPYHSLNRTLMNLPGKMSSHLIAELPYVRLPRPITDRVELMALLGYVRSVPPEALYNRLHLNAVLFATREQIMRGWELYADQFPGSSKNPYRTSDMVSLMNYASDYPDAHRGNFVGLVKKSIEYHNNITRERHFRQADLYGRDAQTALPPIPLPEVDGIKFLDTAGEIAQEGIEMNHCVGSYTSRAIKGYCYLFSISHENERATVEVSPEGRVVQSKGPRNHNNTATKWAARILDNWAQTFPRIGDSVVSGQVRCDEAMIIPW